MEIKTVKDLKDHLENIPNNAKIEFCNWCMYDAHPTLYLSNIQFKDYESFSPTLEIELEF